MGLRKGGIFNLMATGRIESSSVLYPGFIYVHPWRPEDPFASNKRESRRFLHKFNNNDNQQNGVCRRYRRPEQGVGGSGRV